MNNYFERNTLLDTETDQYTLRVHTHEAELIDVALWVRQHSTTCFIVREQATRAHFHAIFGTRKSVDQWRKDFKKKFPHLEGNKHYSLKSIKSQIGIKDYLCKGGNLGELPEILERSPYWTDELILQHHTSFHERHLPEVEAAQAARQGSDSVVVDHAGRSRIRTPTVPERVALSLRRDYPDREWRFSNSIDRRIIYQKMMVKLGEAGKSFDLIVLRRLFNGILHQLCEIESSDFFENQIVDL